MTVKRNFFVIEPATIIPFAGQHPFIANDVFVASGAVIVGDVSIGEKSSLWFNTVVRGDVNSIKIGKLTNIQDNTTVHVTFETGPTTIGDLVTIGHNCVIHACTVKDLALIGMGSTILDGAVIETETFIAAGSVVTPGKTMPSGYMCMGSPCKPIRPLSEGEKAFLKKSAEGYVETANRYAK